MYKGITLMWEIIVSVIHVLFQVLFTIAVFDNIVHSYYYANSTLEMIITFLIVTALTARGVTKLKNRGITAEYELNRYLLLVVIADTIILALLNGMYMETLIIPMFIIMIQIIVYKVVEVDTKKKLLRIVNNLKDRIDRLD